MNDNVHTMYRYRGGVDVLRSIVAKDGVLGLWKGWVPNCQRAAVVCLGGEYNSVGVPLMIYLQISPLTIPLSKPF